MPERWRGRLRSVCRVLLWPILAFATGCGSLPQPAVPDSRPAQMDAEATDIRIGGLRLIGQHVLPSRMEFAGTVVGGLSGIDYDPLRDDYVAISDDRTLQDSPNPPRVLRLRIDFDAAGVHDVAVTGVVFLRQPDGQIYPKVPQPGAPDPEGVRIDPLTRNLVWISEGERQPDAEPPRVTDPFIRENSPDGRAVREYTLPERFRIRAAAQSTDGRPSRAAAGGPRNNAAFEGLSFTPDGRTLAVLMEGPLIGEGNPPDPDTGAWSRLVLFDRASGMALAEQGYPIDPVQQRPRPPTAFRVNGPSEILALSSRRFLVLERSFSVGVVGNQVRLYEIGLADAPAAQTVPGLPPGLPPVSKRLVFDFETLRDRLGPLANLEGLTFGPRLANGNRSLVVVADDNFTSANSDTDRNQILVFEVLPSR